MQHRKRTVWLDASIWAEIRAQATRLGASVSALVQHAWNIAAPALRAMPASRPRLEAAQRLDATPRADAAPPTPPCAPVFGAPASQGAEPMTVRVGASILHTPARPWWLSHAHDAPTGTDANKAPDATPKAPDANKAPESATLSDAPHAPRASHNP